MHAQVPEAFRHPGYPRMICRRYQHYLDSVLESTEEFHEVADLMARHATLAATLADLKAQQAKAGNAAEKAR